MNEVNFRFVKDSDNTDIKSILEIYAPYVLETAVSFEYEVPSIEEFTKRVRDISSEYPYIVAVVDKKIIGYAYAHRHMERKAYQWNVELSVYLHQNFTGNRIGRALYSHLLAILKLQNVINVYSLVTLPNKSSEKLHQYFNFETLGIMEKTGYKFNQWRDVGYFVKKINKEQTPPKEFIPIDMIDYSFVK